MSAWGDSTEAKQEYSFFLHWYNRVAEKYGMPAPIGASRMRRAFWTCRKATLGDKIFERYGELEAGLVALKKAGMTLPGFHGLITRSTEGVYGVEKLLSFSTRTKPTSAAPVKKLSASEIAKRKAADRAKMGG